MCLALLHVPCKVRYKQTGGAKKKAKTESSKDDMRQVSNLLLTTDRSRCVFHLLSTCIVLFYDFLIVESLFFSSSLNEFLYILRSPLASHRPRAAFYYMKYVLLSPRVLNILIFDAPLHLRSLASHRIASKSLPVEISFHECTGLSFQSV